MRTHYDRAISTLERFLSPATARALLTRALKEQGVSAPELSAADLARMQAGLQRGARLFVDGPQRDAAEREIARLCGGTREELPVAVNLEITHERDVGRVRSEARRICTSCGAAPFAMQKVATVVSELARNIVLYAGKGELSISPQRKVNGSPGGKTSIVVCATDQGPGIPNLDHILSGSYRSKTGLGKGLLGTRRLAERFDVSTSAGGTTITAEIVL